MSKQRFKFIIPYLLWAAFGILVALFNQLIFYSGPGLSAFGIMLCFLMLASAMKRLRAPDDR